MPTNLPQSHAAEEALAKLKKMSFDDIMAVPITPEARSINRALMTLNQHVLRYGYLVQRYAISRIGRSKRERFYTSAAAHEEIVFSLISTTLSGDYNTQAQTWELMQQVA